MSDNDWNKVSEVDTEDESIASLGDLLSQPKTVDLFEDDIFNLDAPVKSKPEPAPASSSNLRPFAGVAVLFIILIALLVVFANLVDDKDIFADFDADSETFETINETIHIDRNDEAEIEINASGLFTITAEGRGDFDPVLYVYNNDNEQIGYNDDHTTGSDLDTFDARIEFVYIDGYARIEVSEFYDDSGSVQVTVEQIHLPNLNEQTLTVGQSETFDIDGSEWFELNVGERRELTIIAKSEDNDFDPVLEIYDADFHLIEQNDDHTTGYDYLDFFDAAIEDLRLSGTVYIRVSDYSGDEEGEVTISVK